jgi:hypothetical protein
MGGPTGDVNDDESRATVAGVDATASRARATYVVAAAEAAQSASMSSAITALRDRDRVRGCVLPALPMPSLSGTGASRAINNHHVTDNAKTRFEFRYGGRTTTRGYFVSGSQTVLMFTNS